MFKKKDGKEKKKPDKKDNISKSTLDILPIRFYDDQVDGFIYEDGTYMDIFNIIPSDRRNLQGDELNYNIYSVTKFYRLYSPDGKFISMNFPVNTSVQRAYLQKKLKGATDKVRATWLEREIRELDLLDQNIMRREYYLMFWGTSREDFIKNKDNIEKWIGSGRSRLVEPMTKEKKLQIMKKICNMNSLILPGDLKEEVSDE